MRRLIKFQVSLKEKNDKAGKGCIAPEDGKPKRCVIKVVEYETLNEGKKNKSFKN